MDPPNDYFLGRAFEHCAVRLKLIWLKHFLNRGLKNRTLCSDLWARTSVMNNLGNMMLHQTNGAFLLMNEPISKNCLCSDTVSWSPTEKHAYSYRDLVWALQLELD
jgi:hypothetical protein